MTGLVVFVAVMFVVFQSIYTWARPFMDWIEAGQDFVRSAVEMRMPPGALQSLLSDGVIGGVGSVILFLPQIVFLFLFIAVLEDCGYMARAAFLMDRLMSRLGLSGKSFIPLMSSFACAIPGVMATRMIENRRDRMVTMLIAPLDELLGPSARVRAVDDDFCSARQISGLRFAARIGPPGDVVSGGGRGGAGGLAHEEDDFQERDAPLRDGAANVQVPVAPRGFAPRVRTRGWPSSRGPAR